MTGSKAWELVAPIITPLLAVANANNEMVYDLYLTVYMALKEYDERRTEDGSDRQTGGD